MSAILHAAETWAALSLILFFGILAYFGVHKIVLGMLDARIDAVKQELGDAQAMREEAGNKVDKAQRKLKKFEDSEKSLLDQAKVDAEREHKDKIQAAEAAIERRVAAAQERIEQAELAAQRDIRNRAIAIATAAATETVRDMMTDEQRSRIVDRGIEQVRTHLRTD